MTPTRRNLLGAALGGVAAAAVGSPALAAPAASWQLRWSPSARTDGLGAFETLEDDRADSHPAASRTSTPRATTAGSTCTPWTATPSTDRQRHEVTGLRNGPAARTSSGPTGQTWRVTYSHVHPELPEGDHHLHAHHADEAARHRHLADRRPVAAAGERRADHRAASSLRATPSSAARTSNPLHDKWIDVDFQIKIGNGSAGSVRWILKNGSTTVIDVSRTGVDTFLADRVRPKWGIYRSLGDTSGSLQDCYLLLSNMRGYQLV